MKRSAGVTVIAVLSLLGSAFMLLVGGFAVLISLLAPVSSSPAFRGFPPFFRSMMVLLYVLLTTWGILTSIGLFRLKEWARISILTFSVLLALHGTFTALISLVIPVRSGPNQAAGLADVRIFMAGFSLALLSLGVWWLVFFARRKVGEQFAAARAERLALSTPQVFPPTVGPSVVAPLPSSTGRPLSFTILAWWMLASCLLIPLNLLLRPPAVLFTKVLTGWPAELYFIALLALHLYVGIGLLRLKLTARVVAIAYYCFIFVSTAVFYLAPGVHSRMVDLMRRAQAMFPWTRPLQDQQAFLFDPTPLMVMGACLGLAATLVPLYFLVTRKDAFEKAATAR